MATKRTVSPVSEFKRRLMRLVAAHRRLLTRRNKVDASWYNGLLERFQHPVLTRDHVPLDWRFDLDQRTNPFLLERLGVNATFNPGAMLFEGKVILMSRIEGVDRKSFFAVAESNVGLDGFRYWDKPVEMPMTADPDTNVYDMRLVAHEDGWIYGLFCTERRDPAAPPGDLSSAIAQCGIARTKDLKLWERLPDLKTKAKQQRNAVLHPEFVGGKYAWYTRPQDFFMEAGTGGGIGWGLCESMEHAEIAEETTIDPRGYHTIKELKNGLGPTPIKTPQGWLHLAHAVRNTAAGMRYVLYAFLCDLQRPDRVIARPGGYLLAPLGPERVGDVSNVLFCNGWVAKPNGEILIYYASSDTRTHVARTDVPCLLDYCLNTPEDGVNSSGCVRQRLDLIAKNQSLVQQNRSPLLRRACE